MRNEQRPLRIPALEYSTVNDKGSIELTESEIEAYKKLQQISRKEWRALAGDAWREEMGLETPMPDELEALNRSDLKAYARQIEGDEYNPVSRHDILTRVRHELAFVSIMQPPNVTKALICSGGVDTVYLPDDTGLVRFYGEPSQMFFVDFDASPGGFATSSTAGAQFELTSLINPFDGFYYVRGKNQVYVAGTSGKKFAVACWPQPQ